jgi:O-acetyl-ADP-ribose deacetylase (regulator of RNase III)
MAVEFGTPNVVLKRDTQKTIEAVQSTIKVNGSERNLILALGDITQVVADALVVPANPGFQYAGGGVQSVIARVAGMGVFHEAEEQAKAFAQSEDGMQYFLGRDVLDGLPVGYAITTSTGLMRDFRHLIHVNSVRVTDRSWICDQDVVRVSVKNALEAASRAQSISVALPALGTGLLGLSVSEALKGTIKGIEDFYGAPTARPFVHRIYFAVYEEPTVKNAEALGKLLIKALPKK